MGNFGTKRTEQQVLNSALDESFNPAPLMVESLGFDGTNLVKMKVNSAGELMLSSLVPEKYDYVSLSQTSTEDIYTFKSGGSGGTTVATLTLTFTDATKETLSNAART